MAISDDTIALVAAQLTAAEFSYRGGGGPDSKVNALTRSMGARGAIERCYSDYIQKLLSGTLPLAREVEEE